MVTMKKGKSFLDNRTKKSQRFQLQDVDEPNLYRDVFPYEEVCRVEFDHRVELIDPPEEIFITDTTFRDGQQARPPYTVQQIVDLYDMLHRFRRGYKTRSFTDMKDSQIAQQIATDLGLRAQVEDTEIVHDYLLQHNQADIDFLLERARRIRFEVVVKDKTLYFRNAGNDKKTEAVSLNYGSTLKSFYPRLSTVQQVSEVVVQGWDPKKKEAIVGKAVQGDEVSKMNGSNLHQASCR